MTRCDELTGVTRRAVLKATAAALGVGAMGGASAPEWQSDPNEGGATTAADTPGNSEGATVVGYHSLGGVRPERSVGFGEGNPHFGAQTEIRVRGGHAYVVFSSSDASRPRRGMAIVDIGQYNDATTVSEAEAASMFVTSWVRNNSTATAVMDLKLSEDGDYVFLGTQPFTALFTADPRRTSRTTRSLRRPARWSPST